ncbi:hypothetical protein [Malaciobacter marinus]|uniref:Periplasmic protein n=1 Tax=Malaciobacter marinus TaxID=505249 RepID=A0A347TH35_9BACT|nr:MULTISPECIES: hypothetical protein [Malaciobacter]AXX85913.1 hypothetical protein AMRN_0113 [Malaciobacter marinus]PHO12781.1 hypothetical protein CPG38_05810 [Malaciobacter marinus]PHO14966.1 hypothetical protein CPH92_08915 [Malaciobacter marinus]RYA24288.1 hypothetical protein CRU96_03310 [Malaciobacter halophilus]
MIKKIFFLTILALTLQASTILDNKISNLIGKFDYIKHKNLINYIFKDKHNYIIGENIDYIKVIKKLQSNGLLNLSLDRPKDVYIKFNTNHDPIKSLKILKDTLKSLGFYYYFTKTLKYDKENLNWEIKLKTEAAIDPLILANELYKQNCRVADIKREGDNKWEYSIDTTFSSLNNSIQITVDEKKYLRKPLKPYLLKIKGDASKITVVSKILNNWFPKVVFYDKSLNILKLIKEDKVHGKLVLEVPQNTKYIKIDDLYTLINIKRGLSIIIKE